MPIIAKDKGGADFEPIPAGMHHGVCYGVVDLGTQKSMNPQFAPRRKVRFLFELPGERLDVVKKDGTEKNVARITSCAYTLSLASKGNLRPMLQSWRGRAFTDAELAGFDLRNVLGANCLLNMVHEEKVHKQYGKRVYANIANVNPLTKGMTKCAPENELLYFSLDDIPGQISFPENMPDWLRELISESEEYIERAKKYGVPEQDPDGDEPNHQQGPEDDDKPF